MKNQFAQHLSAPQLALWRRCHHPTGTFVGFAEAEIERSIPARFETIVAICPDRIAVSADSTTLTYAELNRAANRIAWQILARRGAGEEPILLIVEQGIAAVVAILAILKTGKFYVPLDPTFPLSRLKTIVDEVQAPLVLTNQANLTVAATLAPGSTPVLDIDAVDANGEASNPALTIAPDALGYLFYTSGSTGVPKGVPQPHRNILHQVMTYSEGLQIAPEDRLTLLHSHGFSASRLDIFGALLNGAGLYPYSIRDSGLAPMATWLHQAGITIFHWVPSLFRMLVSELADHEQFSQPRLIVLGSEPVTPQDFAAYGKHFAPECLLLNRFGSTETGNIRWNLLNRQSQFATATVPVGYAIPGAEVFLLDDQGAPVEPGQIGKLCVKSKYLTPGFWKRPELTQSTFRADPAGGAERIYVTEDLALMAADGCLEFVGRKDSQVKIRGFRIELGDVESSLAQHPAVQQAVVLAREDGAGERYLAAYMVTSQDRAPTVAELRGFLQSKLPDYMVPSRFMLLDSLPLTPSGKLDRNALPEPQRVEISDNLIAPRDDLETTLCRVWSEELNIESIGIDNDFFLLGGNSMLAAKLFTRLDAALGRSLPLSILFTAPTIRALAEHYRAPETTTSRALVALRSGGTRAPIFAVPGIFGNVVGYADLAREFGSNQPFYGLQSIGLDGKQSPLQSIEAMAQLYVDEIRSVQPNGPYVLMGACFGATVAYEMTRQLLSRGEPVDVLVLLDPVQRKAAAPRNRQDRALQRLTHALPGGEICAQRWQLYVEEMAGLNGKERLSFVGRKIRGVVGSMLSRQQLQQVQREQYQRKVYQANRAALELYRWPALAGELRALEIFTSEGKSLDDFHRPLNWPALWQGPLSIHAVPGKDSGDMLSDKHAAALASLLARRIAAHGD